MVAESWIGFAATSSGALDNSNDWGSVCDCDDCGCDCCCGWICGPGGGCGDGDGDAKEEVEEVFL